MKKEETPQAPLKLYVSFYQNANEVMNVKNLINATFVEKWFVFCTEAAEADWIITDDAASSNQTSQYFYFNTSQPQKSCEELVGFLTNQIVGMIEKDQR